jgi:putative drug exporter of the RND superfamily
MSSLSRLGVRRPRLVLAVWLTAVSVLGSTGLNVERHLHRSNPVVSGTASAREDAQAKRLFGESSSLVALLRGPPGLIDREGPSFAAQLDRQPHVTVSTPWMPDAPPALRPRPGMAVLVLRFDCRFDDASAHAVPVIRAVLRRSVRPPLTVHLTGYADIAAGIERSSLAALKRAEMIAAPLLLLVLLLVFRSPIAASIPLALGMTTIVAVRGVLAFLSRRPGGNYGRRLFRLTRPRPGIGKRRRARRGAVQHGERRFGPPGHLAWTSYRATCWGFPSTPWTSPC